MVKLIVIEECFIGLGFGVDFIEVGKNVFMIVGVLVIVFMIMVYGCFGVIVDFVFVVNMFLIFGVLIFF